jgi:hypothetical protein
MGHGPSFHTPDNVQLSCGSAEDPQTFLINLLLPPITHLLLRVSLYSRMLLAMQPLNQ